MEQQAKPSPTPPPPPKSRMKLRKSQKVLFPILDLGRGLGKEERSDKFPISSVQDILSVRVTRRMDFALHGGVVFSLCLSQLEELLGFKD